MDRDPFGGVTGFWEIEPFGFIGDCGAEFLPLFGPIEGGFTTSRRSSRRSDIWRRVASVIPRATTRRRINCGLVINSPAAANASARMRWVGRKVHIYRFSLSPPFAVDVEILLLRNESTTAELVKEPFIPSRQTTTNSWTPLSAIPELAPPEDSCFARKRRGAVQIPARDTWNFFSSNNSPPNEVKSSITGRRPRLLRVATSSAMAWSEACITNEGFWINADFSGILSSSSSLLDFPSSAV